MTDLQKIVKLLEHRPIALHFSQQYGLQYKPPGSSRAEKLPEGVDSDKVAAVMLALVQAHFSKVAAKDSKDAIAKLEQASALKSRIEETKK